MMLIHVQTCVLGVNLKSYSPFRDVSFNELTSFPTEGLNGLNQLKLVGNFKLKEALAAKDFVNLRCVFLFCGSFGRPSDYRVSWVFFFFFFFCCGSQIFNLNPPKFGKKIEHYSIVVENMNCSLWCCQRDNIALHQNGFRYKGIYHLQQDSRSHLWAYRKLIQCEILHRDRVRAETSLDIVERGLGNIIVGEENKYFHYTYMRMWIHLMG